MSEDEGSSSSSGPSSAKMDKDGDSFGDTSLILDFAGFRRDRHGAVKKKQIEIVKGHR